tara:strand:+ start:626 stop:4033 length:3408 start_codon:yes stop_codon:yes gene_type:complete
MINNITNIDINSAILTAQTDKTTVRLNVSYQSDLSRTQLNNYSLRLFLCTTEVSLRYADYISQRHNEFLSGQAGHLREESYVSYLEQALGSEKGFISTSSPFSPYSTNLVARNLVITDNVSVLGKGHVIPQGVIIYDINLATATTTVAGINSIVRDIIVELPSGTSLLSTLSCHCYVYDNQMPEFFIDESENNLALNTGMTLISKRTFLGTQTSFVPTTPQHPLIGMQFASETADPDEDLITIIQQPPQVSIEHVYTDIVNKVSQTFETNNTYANYNTNKILNRKNYFTDFWMTKDSQENNRFIFSFDLRSYLMDNAIYPFVYNSEFLSNAVLRGDTLISPEQLSSVQSVEVFRHSINSDGYVAVNNLGTSGPGSVLGEASEVSPVLILGINEVPLSLPNQSGFSDLQPTIFYEGCDRFSTDLVKDDQISGKFQYSVKCIIKDSSPEMLRRLVDVLYAQKNRISLVYNLITADTSTMFGNIPAYSVRNGILNMPLDSITMTIDGDKTNAGSVVMETLSSYEDIFNGLNSSTSPINLVSYYENQFSTAQGKINPVILKEIEEIIDLGVRFVHNKLAKIYPADPLGQQRDSNRNLFSQNTSRSTRRNVLSTEHRFTNVFEKGKTDGYGIDYIFSDNPSDEFRSLSIAGLTTRRQEEFRKYFFTTSGSPEMIPNGAYEASSYAYFTPKIIKTPGRPVIDQPSFSPVGSTSTKYDYNRYGQLYADIVSLFQMSEKGGYQYAYLQTATGEQSDNNKNYASIVKVLQNAYGVVIGDAVTPQFKAPAVVKGRTKSTVYNVKDKENCAANGGLQLIQSVIGGENTTSISTQNYLKAADNKIKIEDIQFINNTTDILGVQQDLADRAIKLPFVLLGELTMNKELTQQTKNPKSTFNSLSQLRKILNISQKNITQEVTGEIFNQLPNQLKNMIVVTSTINSLSLGDSDGSLTFDARRFNLNEAAETTGDDLVSFYGESNLTPSDLYPLAEDPMRNYSRFLTFWMNYRQLSVIEYLDGFGRLKSVNDDGKIMDTKYKLSSWKTLNSEVVDGLSDQPAPILCRVRAMQVGDYLDLLGDNLSEQQKSMMVNYLQEKQILELPTYNQYFYITNVQHTEDITEVQTETETTTSDQLQEAAQVNESLGTGY